MSDDIIINDESSVVNVTTVNKIIKNDIEYKPYFSSDGLKIPFLNPISYDDGNIVTEVYYQNIPKDVLIKMLEEYLPEIIR